MVESEKQVDRKIEIRAKENESIDVKRKLSELAKKENELSELDKKLKRLMERQKQFQIEEIRFNFEKVRLDSNYDRDNHENDGHKDHIEDLENFVRKKEGDIISKNKAVRLRCDSRDVFRLASKRSRIVCILRDRTNLKLTLLDLRQNSNRDKSTST